MLLIIVSAETQSQHNLGFLKIFKKNIFTQMKFTLFISYCQEFKQNIIFIKSE